MLISELFPNPVGKDIEGEWIKIFNDESEEINLYGWKIKDASGKTFVFKESKIKPNEILTLNYKTTKISLNNNGETVSLYNSKAVLIDKAEFAGFAPEGKALIRKNNKFIFEGRPAPEQKIPIVLSAQSINSSKIQSENIINAADFNLTNLSICFFLSLILAFLFVFALKKLK